MSRLVALKFIICRLGPGETRNEDFHEHTSFRIANRGSVIILLIL